VSDVDSLKEATDTVTLITLHPGKGLEFPVVFIVGMEEGILPAHSLLRRPAQMEEEAPLVLPWAFNARQEPRLSGQSLPPQHLRGLQRQRPSRF